jgi:oligopeptide transport system permease protein
MSVPGVAGAGAWQRLRASRSARIHTVVLCLLTLGALLAPLLSPYDIDTIDWDHFAVPPMSAGAHWLGTDAAGRDLFVRVAYGVRISLLIAVAATAVSFVIGVSWGAIAGYLGGAADALMMRIVDVLYSLPYIFFVIVLTVLFGSSLPLIFIAIGAVGWLTMARIVRGQTLALRQREFIDAAILANVPTHVILWRHVVPNVSGPVIVFATLTIPQVILFESFLSFLGLGVQEPFTSLGKLIAEGTADMESAPWILLVPAICLCALLLSLNGLGDALRDALDPREAHLRA